MTPSERCFYLKPKALLQIVLHLDYNTVIATVIATTLRLFSGLSGEFNKVIGYIKDTGFARLLVIENRPTVVNHQCRRATHLRRSHQLISPGHSLTNRR